MKVQITHMKAPWPCGAKVGDVVELDSAVIPAWAVGKCVETEAEVTAPAVLEETTEVPDGVEVATEDKPKRGRKTAEAE